MFGAIALPLLICRWGHWIYFIQLQNFLHLQLLPLQPQEPGNVCGLSKKDPPRLQKMSKSIGITEFLSTGFFFNICCVSLALFPPKEQFVPPNELALLFSLRVIGCCLMNGRTRVWIQGALNEIDRGAARNHKSPVSQRKQTVVLIKNRPPVQDVTVLLHVTSFNP